MFLSDQEAASLIKPQKFTIHGPPIKSSSKLLVYQKYTIRILQKIHLENDPHFQCKNYNHVGEYNTCLEEEYTRQSLEILNCTPPWMTDNHDVWCKLNVNGTAKTKEKTWFLLGNNKH